MKTQPKQKAPAASAKRGKGYRNETTKKSISQTPSAKQVSQNAYATIFSSNETKSIILIVPCHLNVGDKVELHCPAWARPIVGKIRMRL